MAVRTTHKLEPWVRFFLLRMRELAALSIQVFKDILALKERIERENMPTFHARRQVNAQALMRALYQTPMVSIKSVAQLIQAQTNTAAALIDDFVKLGILQEFTGQKRQPSVRLRGICAPLQAIAPIRTARSSTNPCHL